MLISSNNQVMFFPILQWSIRDINKGTFICGVPKFCPNWSIHVNLF